MGEVFTSDLAWDLGRLFLALFLGGTIGIERQYHQKDAGIRTHALVGVGAALFTLIGMHPFGMGSTVSGQVGVDATRVAAQVVSGIGFLGAGVIFVDKDAVRGLTTAGAIWLSAAIGTACGAGLGVLAVGVTVMYFVFIAAAGPLFARIPTNGFRVVMTVDYRDRQGVLRRVMAQIAQYGYRASFVSSEVLGGEDEDVVRVGLALEGGRHRDELAVDVLRMRGVEAVRMDCDAHSVCS